MGLKSAVNAVLQQSLHVASTVPQALAQAAHNILTIIGGPVWIKGIFCYANAATGAASTMAIAVCGVNMQTAAVACNLLIGELAIWPLEVAGGAVIIPNVAAGPMPTLAGALLGSTGVLAAPGGAGGDIIVLTIAAADMVGVNSWHVVYYKLSPASLIA